ncbi:hypothetical protein HYC85_015308, partial [Camellia sinensis]
YFFCDERTGLIRQLTVEIRFTARPPKSHHRYFQSIAVLTVGDYLDNGRWWRWGCSTPTAQVSSAASILVGRALTLSLATSATIRTLQAIVDAQQKKFALACGVCKGKGFYICKLCKGKSTIHWSPLYDPLVINPCLCPTCDGNSVDGRLEFLSILA